MSVERGCQGLISNSDSRVFSTFPPPTMSSSSPPPLEVFPCRLCRKVKPATEFSFKRGTVERAKTCTECSTKENTAKRQQYANQKGQAETEDVLEAPAATPEESTLKWTDVTPTEMSWKHLMADLERHKREKKDLVASYIVALPISCGMSLMVRLRLTVAGFSSAPSDIVRER